MEKLGNYYNSELNKYIGEELPRTMTSIDMDLFQIKISKRIIRFCEYKHENEQLGYQQEKAFYLLAQIAKDVNKNSDLFDGWKIHVLLIRGNYPFDNIKILDFVTGKEYEIKDKKEINKFLCIDNNYDGNI